MRNKRKNPNLLIGEIKGNQEVISFIEYNERERRVFKIKCNFCNHEYNSTIENFRDSRKSGQSCIKCSNIQNRNYETLTATNAQVSIVYSNYKSKSKLKKWEFELSKEEFKNIVIQNCYYCGLPPNKFRLDRIKSNRKIDCSFLLNGVDRKDSEKGYVKDNVLPCCEDCNKAKRNLDINTFLKMIKSIYKNLNLDKE